MEEETHGWWLDGSPRRSRVGNTGALYVSPTTGTQPPYHRLSDSRELIHRIARSNDGPIRLKATEVEWRDFEREFVYISTYKCVTLRPNASAKHFNNNNREPSVTFTKILRRNARSSLLLRLS
ncbi:hypothetical protein ALC62_10416 [Cyphomyrmex costatus]|uniref:Uncharacterized protein n=1 Tax=Cyphomyrmex costatus TaxID=456900 RepID=A0A151IDX4_9HYME|nr:hypothetical protein ALC62_10416 [Cyphomyrmex costatus]